MTCPECKGKIKVVGVVHNPLENETYRQRRCIDCNHMFFTVEYEVIQNEKFDKEWTKYEKLKHGH